MASTADLVADSVQDLTVEDSERKTTFKSMSMRQRLVYARQVITVEPLIAFYVMASVVCQPALYNLMFEKACRVNLALNDTVCDAILDGTPHNFTTAIADIQRVIANMHSWQIPIQSVFPLVLVLFLGAYSDRHKLRKPFMLLPIFGEFFAVFGCILCVVYLRTWPLEAQGVAQTVVPSFFGGPTMIVMAVFAYIADVSSLEMRTLRVGIVQIVLNACTPITQSFSGILFEAIGYTGVFTIAGAFYVIALVYGIFCINEPKRAVHDDRCTTGLLGDIFDPKHALETVKLLLKKQEGNNRLFIALIMFILFIYSTVSGGEGTVFALYVKYIFYWTPLEYSYFITANTVIHLIGTVLGVPFFTRFLKFGDFAILACTFLDKIVTNVVLGLAKTVTVLYIGLFVSLITGISSIAIRSLATKVVSENNLGKAQSLFGICEALGPAIAVPIYNTGIYLNTLETFPSAYFFFGIILYIICIIIIIFMHFKEKSNQIQESTITNEKPPIIEDIQITHM